MYANEDMKAGCNGQIMVHNCQAVLSLYPQLAMAQVHNDQAPMAPGMHAGLVERA